MEETMAMNEQLPVENKKENKKTDWKPVVIGGVAGVAMGGVATAAVAATADDTTAEAVVDDTTLTGVDGSAHVDSSVPVAQVSDGMSFSEAFHSAHDQVGPGGVFVWHGQVYHTYTEEEWNSMTPEEHAEFGSRVHVEYDEPTHTSTHATAQATPTVEVVAEPATAAGQKPEAATQMANNGEGNSSQQGILDEPQVTVAQQPGNTEEPLVSGEQQSHIEVSPAAPKVEVMAYETVSNDDGSQMDVAIVSIDDQHMGIYDINQDGTADLAAYDANNNEEIETDEVHDISSEGISMQALHEDYLAQNDSSLQGSDYVNDGNVDNFMA